MNWPRLGILQAMMQHRRVKATLIVMVEASVLIPKTWFKKSLKKADFCKITKTGIIYRRKVQRRPIA